MTSSDHRHNHDEAAVDETSPLLTYRAREDGRQYSASHTLNLSGSLVPEGADPHADNVHKYNSNSDSQSPSVEEHDEDADIEQQDSAQERRDKVFEGMPEIKKQMKYIMPAVAIGVFLAAADQTIIVSSYGQIGSELDALERTSWVATAYFLTLTAFQPLYGKLSDIFGRKACLLFAYAVFGLGCLFCGLARTMPQLIAARAFAGIGGGGMSTVCSILLSDIVPLRERGQWQGYVNIVYAAGAGIGAPLGGILADSIGWRWAFLGQAPLCLLAFTAVGFALRLPRKEDVRWPDKLRRVDFGGALVLLLAVVALLVGLDRGSNVAWRDKWALGLVCASLPLFAVFVAVEVWLAAEPFAPGHVIFEPSLFAAYLCNFFSFAGWLAVMFYVPLYFQAVDSLSATQAGVRLIPGIVLSVSGSLFGGFYMRWTGRYYWLTVGCYGAMVLGCALIVLCSGTGATASLAGLLVGMMVAGFSIGIGVTTSLISLLANASDDDQAVVTACSYLFRSLGSVFGVSVSAAAANQALRGELTRGLGAGPEAEEIASRVRQSLEYLRTLEPEVASLVREAYAKSTRIAFGLQTVLVFGAAVAAWWIRETKLSH